MFTAKSPHSKKCKRGGSVKYTYNVNNLILKNNTVYIGVLYSK